MNTYYTLLTGGLGFIGSHTAIELSQQGKPIILVDNLSNSNLDVFFKIRRLTTCEVIFYQIDILDFDKMQDIFTKHDIDSVIHFAAFKSVNTSIQTPLSYYDNNVTGLINLLKLCLKNNVNKFIFSSSGSVYGNSISPLAESNTTGIGITNPYSQTKHMGEIILRDTCYANPEFSCVCLRYFNPSGAHPSGLLGENPNGIPTNLMPYILRVASKHQYDTTLDDTYKELTIFGGDYGTTDGTCVRDFVHVTDVAKAHLVALQKIQKGFDIYNVGTGKGSSVLTLLNTFKQINQISVPYVIKERREGDWDITYCDANKIEKELGWKAEKSLEDICKDAWNFINNN